jgi:hypothetical protein
LAKLKAWFPLLGIAIAVGTAILLRLGSDLPSQIMAGVTLSLMTTGAYEVAKNSSKIPALATPTKTGGGE